MILYKNSFLIFRQRLRFIDIFRQTTEKSVDNTDEKMMKTFDKYF